MCWKCGKPIEISGIFRNSVCDFCGADLHSCRNCKFYEPGSHYDCHETVDELVSDKERSNFCDLFSVKKVHGSAASSADKAAAARDQFNSLFGN